MNASWSFEPALFIYMLLYTFRICHAIAQTVNGGFSWSRPGYSLRIVDVRFGVKIVSLREVSLRVLSPDIYHSITTTYSFIIRAGTTVYRPTSGCSTKRLSHSVGTKTTTTTILKNPAYQFMGSCLKQCLCNGISRRWNSTYSKRIKISWVAKWVTTGRSHLPRTKQSEPREVWLRYLVSYNGHDMNYISASFSFLSVMSLYFTEHYYQLKGIEPFLICYASSVDCVVHCILWKRKDYFLVRSTLTPVSTIHQLSPVHTVISDSLKH